MQIFENSSPSSLIGQLFIDVLLQSLIKSKSYKCNGFAKCIQLPAQTYCHTFVLKIPREYLTQLQTNRLSHYLDTGEIATRPGCAAAVLLNNKNLQITNSKTVVTAGLEDVLRMTIKKYYLAGQHCWLTDLEKEKHQDKESV